MTESGASGQTTTAAPASGPLAGDGPTPAQRTVLDAIAATAGGQASSENFPVALRVLPRRVRDELMAAYRFSRFVDDVGDEAPGDRIALLSAVDSDVRRLAVGRPRLDVIAGMAPVVAAGLGIEPLHDLIEANRQDQTVAAYDTFGDLLDYCRLSAAPIGRMVLAIAGALTTDNMADSDAVCAALQVLEHCQDVGEDARAGRVYLPQSDLADAGADPSRLLAGHTSPELRRVVLTQVDRSASLLERGAPLVGRLHGWSRVAVAGYVAGGLATVEALRRSGGEVIAAPVKAGKRATLARAARLAVRP